MLTGLETYKCLTKLKFRDYSVHALFLKKVMTKILIFILHHYIYFVICEIRLVLMLMLHGVMLF